MPFALSGMFGPCVHTEGVKYILFQPESTVLPESRPQIRLLLIKISRRDISVEIAVCETGASAL